MAPSTRPERIAERAALLTEGKRRCAECQDIKPLERFSRNRTARDGYEYFCKSCIQLHRKGGGTTRAKQRKADAEDALRLLGVPGKRCTKCQTLVPLENFVSYGTNKTNGTRLRVSVCKPCWNKFSKENYDRATKTGYSRKYRYGISRERFESLLAYQNNKCAICGSEYSFIAGRRKGALAVDHDHATGAIRGLLCVSCNRAVGYLGDYEDGVQRALDYLRNPPAANVPEPQPSE